MRGQGRARGVYLFPNLLTAANLLAGTYSVLSSFQGRLKEAAVAILVAAFFDGVDGRVARLTRTSSRFGMEFDSLCDVVSFGVAPAVLFYQWGLQGNRIGWLGVFLYVVCGALRLARFGSKDGDKLRHFQGLPIPSAGCLLASFLLFSQRVGIRPYEQPALLYAMLYILSFLMVSTLPYPSFKEPQLFRRKPFSTLVGMILLMAVMLVEFQIAFFPLTIIYASLGPLRALRRLLQGSYKEVPHE